MSWSARRFAKSASAGVVDTGGKGLVAGRDIVGVEDVRARTTDAHAEAHFNFFLGWLRGKN